MRGVKRSGSLMLSLLLNILLNFEGIIPPVALLVLHFLLGISIWWSAAALALWLLGVALLTLILTCASRCDVPVSRKENKNPYSATNKQR